MIRPANENWVRSALSVVEKIKKDRASGKVSTGVSGGHFVRDVAEALWKPPDVNSYKEEKQVDIQLTTTEQQAIESIEEKTRILDTRLWLGLL